ncbi:MAG: hypothetical protein CL521_05510 [Actinobacteria bacterium]|nr:hypothetical protein [Actinomycetota bacterium]
MTQLGDPPPYLALDRDIPAIAIAKTLIFLNMLVESLCRGKRSKGISCLSYGLFTKEGALISFILG